MTEHWAPKPLYPAVTQSLFEMSDDPVRIEKGVSPLVRQRRADGTPYTRQGATALGPEEPGLYLGDDKVSKSVEAQKEVVPTPDPCSVIKAYLSFND